ESARRPATVAGGATETYHWSPKTKITAVGSRSYIQRREFVEDGMPTIIDLDAEAAKLTMFRGQTPRTTRAERKGTAAQLGRYRDGLLLVGKAAGTGHWETHPEDELVHVLDGTAILDIVQEDGPRSFALGAGMIAIVPPTVWHRFRSV